MRNSDWSSDVCSSDLHDAAPGGGGNVDVVYADAGAADDLQPVGGSDDLRGHLRRGADGEAVVLADDGFQLVRLQAGLHVHLDAALAEDFRRAVAQLIRNQYLGHVLKPSARGA